MARTTIDKAFLRQEPGSLVNAANCFPGSRPFFDDAHSHSRHPAYDFGLRREVKPANILARMRVRNND